MGKYAFSLDGKGITNFEFEAKLYADLVNFQHIDYVTSFSSGISILGGKREEYINWLSRISNNHTTYPDWDAIKDKYYQYLDFFEKDNPEYNFPIDIELKPITIFEVL